MPRRGESAGDRTFKLGVHHVNPGRDTGRVSGTREVHIDSATRLSVAMGRMPYNDLELEFFVGLPYRHEGGLNAHLSLGFNMRQFDFDSRARLNGTAIGTVNVDPWVIGVHAQYAF